MDPTFATASVEDEEDICRICRNPGDADHPLRYPCICRGSIKFVHQDCLLQWLNHRKALHCEICKYPFSFSPVYAENTPTMLPLHEFVIAMGMKTCRVIHLFLRWSFVLSIWLIVTPSITFWIWRLAFVRSFGEAKSLLLSHISTKVILIDCVLGFLLWAVVFFFDFRENILRNNLKDLFTRLLELIEDEEDRDDDDDDVPLDWLVRVQGPVLHLVVFLHNMVFRLVLNPFTVLADNLIFLGFVIFVPFTLGRVTLYLVSWLFTAGRAPVVSDLTNEGHGNRLLGQLTDLMRVNGSELHGAKNILSLAADILKGSLAAGGSKLVFDVTTLTVGYMFIVFLMFLYLGVVALIRYAKGELTVGRFYDITVPSLIRQSLAAMRHLMTMNKVAFFLVFEFGVFPLMCGWSLDVCTVRMFDKTISHRVQFLSISPLASSLVHWVLGLICTLYINFFESLLGEVLRPGLLHFLDDLEDPNVEFFQDLIDTPVHKQARKVFLVNSVYGSLIFMLVCLPLKFTTLIAPSIFPFDISISDPFTEIPVDMLLFQMCIQFLIEHFSLSTNVTSLLRCWVTGVGWVLGLTDFLLPKPEDNIGQENGNDEPRRQNRAQVLQVGGSDRPMAALPAADDPNRSILRAGSGNTGEEYEDDEKQSDLARYNFVARIILLLLVAWVTLLLFTLALIVVPVSLGRALFSAIPLLPITHGIKCNDLYAFFIGTYAFLTTIYGASHTIEHVKSKSTSVLLKHICIWCGIIFKSSVLLAIWVFIIPVLIGRLIELLVIVPIRVPVDETPVFLLYQDWALGLMFWKIWTRLVLLDHMRPIVDDSWREKFERVREDGFLRLQGLWVLKEIEFPIMMKLLTALCVPYVLARGVFPMLGYPVVVNSAVYRFAWIGCLSVMLFCFCAKRCNVWFRNLHNSIRDDRYLIGRRLDNFGEAALAANENQSSEDAGDGVLIGREGDVDNRLRLRRATQQEV
ncbi:PREDICTED: probable E3 ubiquitin ligase SUD1 [Camelina sativa]|uniref:RING-type E3 ubiquitin transferase n=1 Tax=Camelina sativa TaxID=90675 RepID=A0ABM0UVY4_CAMSA|nr:PREDICTED: probable E3 ubiquitin ligase SUD1 [Camelina sativa]